MSLLKKTLPSKSHVINAIDIGTSKITCASAIFENNTRTIIASNSQISHGIHNGTITDLEKLSNTLINCISSIEKKTKQSVFEVIVNISNSNCQFDRYSTKINLHSEPIKEHHLKKIKDLVFRQKINNRYVVQIIDFSYTINDNNKVQNPIGMFADTLRADYCVISVPMDFIYNLLSCFDRIKVKVTKFISDVTIYSNCLLEDEKSLGVSVIDIGSNKTTIASFLDNKLIFQKNINLGGYHVTYDISQGLNVNLLQAERLKNLYATLIGDIDGQETILINNIGESVAGFANQISKNFLDTIVKARCSEIIENILKVLMHEKSIDIKALQRFVLIGGGSQLQGLKDKLAIQLKKPVRMANSIRNIECSDDFFNNIANYNIIGMLNFFNTKDKLNISNSNNNKRNALSNIVKLFSR